MKKLSYLILIIVIYSNISDAQNADRFFKESDLINTGVYYYPEQWDSTQWERDIKNIADMGFEFIHLGEFAWTFYEPEEGKFDFEWYDQVISLAEKYKLKLVLCTPSAAPPVWAAENYPEILMVDENGIKMRHGSRQQISWSSKKYRELVTIIDKKLAERYGKNKNVIGWQIDNEPSHYGRYDYSEETRLSFINWLKKKYKDINSLNKAWGTAFWSIRYQNFEQIRIPNQKELVQQADPHALLDYKSFSADEAASFLSFQKDILRKSVLPEQWITTNFMDQHLNVDPYRSGDLDFACYTMYPVSGYRDGEGEQGFRIGQSKVIPFASDFHRGVTGITGLMELQPGQVNWGIYNYQPYPGAVRLWLWTAFASKCSFIGSYRYRQPLYGYESYHYGMVGTDGVTLSPGGEQYKQFMQEVKQLRAIPHKDKTPSAYSARKTAVLWNPANIWETDYLPATAEWKGLNHFIKYHSIVKSFVAPVDIINEEKDFSNYKFIIAPSYQLIDKELVKRWKEYVENGGNLILTCRTGQKDRNGHLWEALFTEPIHELLGARIEFYDILSSNRKGKINFNNKLYDWNIWGDILQPDKGTEVLAVYADQFYKGRSAAVTRKLGKGTVSYIGADSEDGKFEKDVLKQIYKNSGVTVADLPDNIIVDYSKGFWIALNYSSDEIEAPVPEGAKIIIGSKTLKPAEVVVWTEE
jgi:beta-galactosidase